VPAAASAAGTCPPTGRPGPGTGLVGDARGGGVADGQAAVGVEELEVAVVDGELDLLAGLDRAARRDPGRPHRLVAGDRDYLVVGVVSGRLGDAVMLHRGGVDAEDDVDLAAEFLGDGGAHRHPRP